MKESNYWEFVLIIVIAVLGALMFRSMQLGLLDMVVQWLGILLAFLLALISSEVAKIKSEEKRAESIIDDLVFELKEALKTLKTREETENIVFYSATWSYIKASGLPDRIPQNLRKAFADAFLMLDIANESGRQLRNYNLMSETDQVIHRVIEKEDIEDLKAIFRVIEEEHIEDLKNFEKDCIKALNLHKSTKKSRFSIR